MTLRLFTTRVRVLWESLSTSYWFIPLLMMSISVALCYACLSVIERAFLPDVLRPLVPLVTQQSVQQLLSTVNFVMVYEARIKGLASTFLLTMLACVRVGVIWCVPG